MEQYGEDDWDRVMNVNLKGTFNFCHAAAKTMISQRYGRIINIASIMGERALPPRASYCASKGGIIALTKDLAAEWAEYNITVNAISPGWIQTELTKNYFANEEVRGSLLQRIPMGRFGRPEEVATLAVFLASDRSSYITGQNFSVDGGWTVL
jgi:NAD(P)-dependent dehydrogenase (short-subunit alcohol dehydrogenase family)